MASDGSLTLSGLVEAAADELRKAKVKADVDPVMQFTGCEIELDVKVAAEGAAGFKIWILEVGGKASKERSGTIKLTFGPLPGEIIAAVAMTPGDPGPVPERKGG